MHGIVSTVGSTMSCTSRKSCYAMIVTSTKLLLFCYCNKKKETESIDDSVSLIGGGGQTRTDDLWVMSPTSCHCSTPRFAGAKVRQILLFVKLCSLKISLLAVI